MILRQLAHLLEALMHTWPFSYWSERTEESRDRARSAEREVHEVTHEQLGRLHAIELRAEHYANFGFDMVDPDPAGAGDLRGGDDRCSAG